jgi:hypothetical protein
MGYEVLENTFGDPCVFREGLPLIPLTDPWNLFGLAVEWIEARGYLPKMRRWVCPPEDPLDTGAVYGWEFDVTYERRFTTAPTLPTAAARWLVEHGHLLCDATKMVKEGSDG